MPDLLKTLQAQDAGFAKIVAEQWGLEPGRPLEALAQALLQPDNLAEMLELLPDPARQAFGDLAAAGGKMLWPRFARRFGEIREMGEGRRDREKPYLSPVSASESLYYSALIGRAFFTETGVLQEFAYIPDDFLPLVGTSAPAETQVFGRPAKPDEREWIQPAQDVLLDDACTRLAALRLSLPAEQWMPCLLQAPENHPGRLEFLQALLLEAGIMLADGQLNPEKVKSFFESSRGEALSRLVQAWQKSAAINELRLTPGLTLEGAWANPARKIRHLLLRWLQQLPAGVWWSLPAFLADIKQKQPDFQRPAGDFDSWYIRRSGSEEFLRGFARWDEVEGAYLRFLITGIFYWLGLVDLASPAENAPGLAFRLSAWAPALLAGQTPGNLPAEEEKLIALSDAGIHIPRFAPRLARYQISRFARWEGMKAGAYRLRITPSSLAQAAQQGLTSAQLLALLRKYAAALPPSLVRAVERWERDGSQARLEAVLLLRLSTPEMLKELRQSKAARFLGDPIGPTAVIVKPGAWEKVLAILAEIGYLGEGV